MEKHTTKDVLTHINAALRSRLPQLIVEKRFSLYLKGTKPVFELNRDAVLSLLHTARLELPEGWALDLSLAENLSPSGRHIVAVSYTH
ncbi:MAG: hypothetical protein N3E49_09570, partial [Bacteroidia bacterium]|nr:hypothetical protein [Bacteroidia bacterium]